MQIQPDETSKIGVFVKVGNKWPLVGCEYRESAHNLDWRVMNFLLSRCDVKNGTKRLIQLRYLELKLNLKYPLKLGLTPFYQTSIAFQ